MKRTALIFGLCGVFLFPLAAQAATYCYSGAGSLLKLKLAFACSATGAETLSPVVGRIILGTGDHVTFSGTCVSKAGQIKIGGFATNASSTTVPWTILVDGVTPGGLLLGGYSNAPFSTFTYANFNRVSCSSVPPPPPPSLPVAPNTAGAAAGVIR